MLEKIKSYAVAFLAILASIFYVLWSKKRTEAEIAKRNQEIQDAETEAHNKAVLNHENAKNDGPISVANDIANLLDKSN